MNDLQELLEQHRRLAKSMPRAWNPFFARFGSLRPIQLAAMPLIVAGNDTLITAPTAGGKTEAIAAPVCERLSRSQWPGLSVILITPTRALVNDLYQRLERPLAEMRIVLGRKTADHPMDLSGVPQFLITTPESTESLLTFRKDILKNLQVLIVDEIHLLDGTPRGDQLRLLMQRVLKYRQHVGGPGFVDVQRIAMSATVSDPQRLAKRYLGARGEVVSVPGQRHIESKILVTSSGDEQAAAEVVGAFDSFPDVHKVLVFVNSRKQVDALTKQFQSGAFAKAPVYGHHGSLAKDERERVEARFKSDERAVCVATMTLEVGIDIGDIDLVVCIDPPFSLSSFLQRIGRGCRRLKGLTRVLCVARNRAGELMFEALVAQAASGMPSGPLPPLRRSVLVQQVLAYMKQVDKHRRSMDQLEQVLSCSDAPALPRELLRALVKDMCETGLLDVERNGVLRPARAGWDFIESNQIFSNMAPPIAEALVVNADTGEAIATVAGTATNGVRIAGTSYDILPGSSATRILVRTGGDHPESPQYSTASLPYSYDLGCALANRLGIPLGTVLAVEQGGSFLVFTWLGRLLNIALAKTMQRSGRQAAGEGFYLRLATGASDDLLAQLKAAVSQICSKNPFAGIAVESSVDVGPYFRLLSPSQQKCAREDWLDTDFLQSWINSKQIVKRLTSADELAADLIAITRPRG